MICFYMGVLFAYTHSWYPLLGLLASCYLFRGFQFLFFFLLGIFLGQFHERLVYPQGIPPLEVIPHALVEGKVVSEPLTTRDKTQFLFELSSLNQKPATGLLQLAWYNKRPVVHRGDCWRFAVKLKKPRNFHNPGSFDFAGMLRSKHVFWTGYIHSKQARLLGSKQTGFSWIGVRNVLAASLYQLAPNRDVSGIVETLTVNISTHISQTQWDLFRRTGTTHLFGISGEHIALIAGLVFWLVRTAWSRSEKACLRFPAFYPASLAAFGIALLYSFLAGFGPPVQRALTGCFFYTLCYLGKKNYTSWQVWRYALLAVLLVEPHAVFMQGFYFSFLAVACLLLTQERWGLDGFKGKLALQGACLVSLMPLSLYWYGYGSLNGYFANLFAIPLTGLLIVPLALITMVFSHCGWAWLLMKPLSWLVSVLIAGLHYCEYLEAMNINVSFSSIIWVLALLLAMLCYVLLPIQSLRRLSILWLLLPFIPPAPSLRDGEARVQVLDVGQGLAVLVQTRRHTLLYDAGDAFFTGNDMGNMVILPFLKAQQITKIDRIVISHPDMDHRGGLASVEAQMPGTELIVNDPEFYHRGSNCHEYPSWEWEGVRFNFLPINMETHDRNNRCCILKISTAAASILFTGDIEKMAENYLVKTYGSALKADYLIVPHHGSKTSSTFRFLLEVQPSYAIASLGFDNRFHFPHAQTLANLASLNIPFYRSDHCGMVSLSLPAKGPIPKPLCYLG